MAQLKDPALPSGAIVATHEEDESLNEGQVRRNDGVVLNPASKNPWYVLATVAGEQSGRNVWELNYDLHLRNRRFWNGWMCQNLSEHDRAALAEEMELDAENLKPLSDAERAELDKRFADAFPDQAYDERKPDPKKSVDASRLYFSRSVSLQKCWFPLSANFSSSYFEKIVDFSEATFAGQAHFSSAYFGPGTTFSGTHFSGTRMTGLVLFDNVHFDQSPNFEKAKFDGPLIFHKATFGGGASFAETRFTAAALFKEARFDRRAAFNAACFGSKAEFENARFYDTTNFEAVRFCAAADFQTAHFAADANFRTAHFAGSADFQNVKFEQDVDFSNGAFGSKTIFKEANFKDRVPEFFHREMHQDTSFSDSPEFWPDVTEDNAEEGKRAYTRLRQVASEVYDPDLEHFFLRQEMRCKERIERDKRDWFHWFFFFLYRKIADSGISVSTPFWLMVCVLSFGTGCFAGYFDSGAAAVLNAELQDNRYASAAGVSFGNLFGFLGINRLYFTDLLISAPDGLQFVAGLQTVLGVVLLFFFGLGLRNRFRLK